MRAVLAGALVASALALAAPEPGDPWRPLYHFTPPRHFMNDPNGLVHLGGEYHSSTSTTPRATPGGT
jgi:sucrose-6-phosphate hydrolase SacC (GH32 family)